MSRQHVVRTLVGRLGSSVALSLLTASCWWGWMAWDHSYRIDPATGTASGPYQAWQVIGCVVCLLALAVVATFRLRAWLIIPIMPAAFTTAWSWTATNSDSTGLWVIGAGLVLLGMLAGTAAVVGVTFAVRTGKAPGTSSLSDL